MRTRGFTLIELAIVLVIIGLLVGGVLMGQDLIRAAMVRAQISQIEQYSLAVNTFRDKYASLPGDMSTGAATQFGFSPRGTSPGEGDGNGVVEGWNGTTHAGTILGCGETATFWVDLSSANGLNINLIDQSFHTATETSVCAGANVTGSGLDAYFPAAKIQGGNYIYVWSSNSINYFGIGSTTQLTMGNSGVTVQGLGLTVRQAYEMDRKIDDSFPLTGHVTTYTIRTSGSAGWAPNFALGSPPADAQAISGDATTCFDNGGSAGAKLQYSLSQNGGAGVNCAISFTFQ